MSLTLLATLAGLALIDSLSFGTLGVPLVIVVAARKVNWRGFAVYFATVCLFYFVVGTALLLGVDASMNWLSIDWDATPLLIAQLAIGAAMLVGSFFIGKDTKDASGEPNPRRSWRPSSDSPGAMVAIGLTAALLEVATMVPYLSAIGLLTANDSVLATKVAVLAVYCLVMIAPALAVLLVAAIAGRVLWDRLDRLADWLQRASVETVGWMVGIAGFFIAGDAVSRLGWFS